MQRAERGWEKLNNVGTNYELWEPYLLRFNIVLTNLFLKYFESSSFFRGFKVQSLTLFFAHVCY